MVSTSARAESWRDVWYEIDAWGGLGDNFSVRKVKAHTTPEAVLAGVITADDRLGNDLADAACKLVVLEHRVPPNISEARLTANLAVTRMAHDERLQEGASECDLGSCPCQRSWPPSEEGTRLSTASQGAFARSASTLSARHAVRCPGASGARLRYNSGLMSLRATELLISCREARWCQCSAPCVVRAVLAWCEDRCKATVLVLRLLGDVKASVFCNVSARSRHCVNVDVVSLPPVCVNVVWLWSFFWSQTNKCQDDCRSAHRED